MTKVSRPLLLLVSSALLVAGSTLLQRCVLAVDPSSQAAPGVKRWLRMHEQFVKQAARGNIDLLFIGDSITEYWLTDGRRVWESEFSRWQTANFGIAGDTTQGVYERVTSGELDRIDPRVVVLLIGTNNVSVGLESPQTIAANIGRLVSTIQRKLPQAKILLLGVFPREKSPDAETRKTVSTINKELTKLDDGKSVRFLDIGRRFLDQRGFIRARLMPDNLHLSEEGYRIWADAMRPVLEQLMSS